MMASLSLSTLPITATTKKPNTCSRSPLFSKPSPRRFKVSCNGAGDDDHKTHYVTAPEDIRNCTAIQAADPLRSVDCCPTPPVPYYQPKYYVLPPFQKTRVRPAAQRVTSEYIKKYELAIKRMKDLDDDDPHSWIQQAKIHCAYCCKAYKQGNNIGSTYRIDVRKSSLFFPFHRWYLYFHERILGKLLDDETFALPYWNWDHPTGMVIPAMYEAQGRGNARNNPLFNPHRNGEHLPPTAIDLNCYEGKNDYPAMLVQQNLCIMRRQMIDNAYSAKSFFGVDPSPPNPLPAVQPDGTSTNHHHHQLSAGCIENSIHNAVHDWTGNPRLPMNEDMGGVYSAGYDPIFYAHHANIDRMWTIWKNLDPKQRKHQEPKSDAWLHASYVFYDENRKLVRVRNKDCLDTIRMGYEFEKSPTPWENYRSVPRHKKKKKLDYVKRVEDMVFPVKLDTVIKVYVKRPVKKRSNEDKQNAKEVLFLNGIKFDGSVYLTFDVLVNAVDDEIETTASDSEFAGSYTEMAHQYGGNMFTTSGAGYGITQLLEDVDAEDEDYVLVTLVPRAGAEEVTISEIKIELVPIDD